MGRVADDGIFQREVLEKYGLEGEAFFSILERIVERYEAFEPLWQALPALRRKYRLGVINNGTALTLPAFEARFHMAETFDQFVSSARVGICKPDPRIYRLAAGRLGVLPAECLYMDDSLPNVEGARAVGMQALWWQTHAQGWKEVGNWLLENESVEE